MKAGEQQPEPESQLVGVSWIVKRTGLDRSTVRRRAANGTIPVATRLAGRYRFDLDQIAAWIASEAQWLSVSETAKRLGSSSVTIHQRVKDGQLRARTIGSGQQNHHLQIDVASIEAYEHARSRERTPFQHAVKTALARSGLTVLEAAARTGIRDRTVHGWMSGQKVPFRDNLERFTEVTGEPNLVNLIESQPRTIRLTCRECGAVKEQRTGKVRASERRSPTRITVDWEKGEGTYVCARCTSSGNAKKMIARVVKRKGHKGLLEGAKHLAAWREKHPEELTRNALHASASRQPKQLDERGEARYGLAMLHLKPEGTMALCASCRRLLFTEAAHARVQRSRGGIEIGKFHAPCDREWRRSETYRAWASSRETASRSGYTAPRPMPPPPSSRPVTEASLLESYQTTLRFFWCLERVGRVARDGDGHVLSVAQLAKRLHIDRTTLYRRVENFLALLPDETLATGRVKRWREIFLTLRQGAPK
jgi:predicted DNA-binding transcriptional regulator AlpA